MRPAPAALAAAVAAAAFALLAVLTLSGALRGPDLAVHGAVRQLGHWEGTPPSPDDTGSGVRTQWHSDVPGANFVGALGEGPSVAAVAAALAAALWAAGRRRSATVALAGAAANGAATLLLQAVLVPLAAPLRAGADGPYPQMFPSGHTMGALFTAGLVAGLLLRRIAALHGRPAARWTACAAFVAALLVGAARVLEGQHLPSDVLGGAAAGAAVLLATLAADARWGG